MKLHKQHLRWTPFYALLRREIARFMKVIYQTIATPLIVTTLYLMIFGLSIGKEIREIQNHSYLAFIIPGLIMMTVLRNAFENSSGSITTSKFCGELEDLRRVPLSPSQICWAHASASTLRGIIVGIITFLIGLIFYYIADHQIIPIHSYALVAFFAITGGIMFSFLGLSVSMLSTSFDHVNSVNIFLLLPLIYLGGVFFSLEQLHPFWQTLSTFNPILYLVNGMRYAIFGISDVQVATSMLVSVIGLFLFNGLAIYSLKKGSYQRW